MSVDLCRLGTGFVAELLRHGFGDTHFQNGSLGLSATSMAGVGKAFNREPGGTLNFMTTGGDVLLLPDRRARLGRRSNR